MPHLRVGPLVRAISATSAVIWAEFTQPCEISLSASPSDFSKSDQVTVSTRTVAVGGRHYAAPQLIGLQPATWYTYHLRPSPGDTGQTLPIQCFRTLDPPEAGHSLALAYGSCRKYPQEGYPPAGRQGTGYPQEVPLHMQHDALSAFGSWLIGHFSERETFWPRLLLLIGDQIYADEPTDSLVEAYPLLQNGAQTFTDFALMYEHTWACDENVRQVLAALPTYMILDDHEIINNYNIIPTWRARAIKRGLEQLLVDGMVAYWVYQGWGNLHQQTASDPRLRIMQKAAQSGEDALVALRECIRLNIVASLADDQEAPLHWHYQIPTSPPIFVADMRADRPAVFTDTPRTNEPARIMSRQQMTELSQWLYEKDATVSILISSVPVLLPPLIGLCEYLMGIRLWQGRIAPLRWLGRQLGRIQQWLARRTSFDHWPVFPATWHELVKNLAGRQHDILVLSGDVHFSYAAEAQRAADPTQACLYQFVSTPLQNRLNRKSRQMIVGQAWCKRTTYGSMRIRMLPMYTANKTERVPHDLLMENTVALVTLRPQRNGRYEISQEYWGLVDGKMGVIGYTSVSHHPFPPAQRLRASRCGQRLPVSHGDRPGWLQPCPRRRAPWPCRR